MKYKFPFENGNIADGEARLYIVDGIAEAKTEAEIALAEYHGGEPVKAEPKKPKAAPEPEIIEKKSTDSKRGKS